MHPASVQPVEAADAVAQLTNLAISRTADLGICKRYNLVEIAEACWGEAKYLNGMAGIQPQSKL